MADVRDLTKGNLITTLLTFALPFIGANFLQALYGAADLIIVGRFCESHIVSAVATGSQLLQTLIMFITGLTISATVLIGKAFGAKKYEEIVEIINTMTICFIVAAFVMSILLTVFDDTILRLLQTPKEAFEETEEYILICSWGLVFIFGYNAVSSILRGLGNSAAPMFFVAISCLINIIADILLVGVFNFGAGGAAFATVLSQAVSVVIGFIYLRKGNFVFDFKFREIKFNIKTAKELFKIGLPLSLQDTLIPLSFLFIFSLANSMGVAASAAYGSVVRLNAFMMLPAGSFSMALTALVAQNIGANNTKRAVSALRYSVLFSFAFGIVFFLWQQIAPHTAVGIFTPDEEVLKAGTVYLRSFSFDYLLVPFVFCLNGFLFGCGRTVFSALNSLIAAFCFRIPVAFILCTMIPGATLFELGIAPPAASLFSCIFGYSYLVYLNKSHKLFPKQSL